MMKMAVKVMRKIMKVDNDNYGGDVDTNVDENGWRC